jgi:hypothetical protein
VSGPYRSAATGTEIVNLETVPADGDAGAAASSNVPDELLADDIFRLRARLAYNEAASFCEPGDGLALRGGGGNVAGEHTWAPWSLEQRMIHAYNDGTAKRSLDGGYTWGTEINLGATTMAGAAAQSDSTGIVHVTGGGSGQIAFNGPGNAWTSFGLAGTTPCVPLNILADPFRASTYWVGGSDNALPKVWQQVSVNGASPTQTQYALTGGTAGINVLAVGRNLILAASNTAGTSRLWQITPGGAGVAVTPPSATFIVDIQWLDSFGWFLLIASNGATLEIWTSLTGGTGTWTSRGTIAFQASNFVANASLRGSCVVGPLSYGGSIPSPFVSGALPCLVVLPVTNTTISNQAMLALSADGGVTWQLAPNPLARHVSLAGNNSVSRCRVVNNRLIAYGYNAGGNVAAAFGLRAGRPGP